MVGRYAPTAAWSDASAGTCFAYWLLDRNQAAVLGK